MLLATTQRRRNRCAQYIHKSLVERGGIGRCQKSQSRCLEHRSGKSSERHAEGARPPRRRKYISVIFGPRPEQALMFSRMTYHREVSSEAQISLRRSRHSSPHLAPRTASRQIEQIWTCKLLACAQTLRLTSAHRRQY